MFSKLNDNLVILLLLLLIYNLKCELLKPRGVPVSHMSLYSPDKNFVCFDGSLSIPFNRVNDDYCDCKDSSDEPGTSACPNGSFYCSNIGYNEKTIPSSRVNDGICDCCDGSDEYNSSKTCLNICYELGQTAKIEEEKKLELIRTGNIKRQELILNSKQVLQEKKDSLEKLEKDKQEAEALKHEKEQLKNEYEAKENEALEVYRAIEREQKEQQEKRDYEKNLAEAQEIFLKYDVDNNGKIHFSEIQSIVTFDRDQNGEVSEEEAKYYLGDQPELELEDFVKIAWPLIKSKAAIDMANADQEQLNEEEPKEDETHDHHEEVNEESEDEEEKRTDENQAETFDQADDTKTPEYDEETRYLIDQASEARNEFTKAQHQVGEIESEIRKINEVLKQDFGPESEYLPLNDQCFEYTDREYVYKLCLFNHVTQKPRNGGSETRLGAWSRWSNDKYDEQVYDRGQACWNGPQRSAIVKISCGVDTEIKSVSEPNRCEYLMELQTPAACVLNDSNQGEYSEHDEL